MLWPGHKTDGARLRLRLLLGVLRLRQPLHCCRDHLNDPHWRNEERRTHPPVAQPLQFLIVQCKTPATFSLVLELIEQPGFDLLLTSWQLVFHDVAWTQSQIDYLMIWREPPPVWQQRGEQTPGDAGIVDQEQRQARTLAQQRNDALIGFGLRSVDRKQRQPQALRQTVCQQAIEHIGDRRSEHGAHLRRRCIRCAQVRTFLIGQTPWQRTVDRFPRLNIPLYELIRFEWPVIAVFWEI